MKAQIAGQVMEKFTTILSPVLALAAILVVNQPAPAAAGCLQEVSFVETQARWEPDWMRRETVLAMLIEARRDANKGREAACMVTVDKARAQLRGQDQSQVPAPG